MRPGTVTGFLGPNGAGKSTTMRLMLHLVRGSGATTFDGRRIDEFRRPLRTVGAVLDPTAHNPRRPARSPVRMFTAAAGTGAHRADEGLDLVGLSDVADRASGEFSLGMQQRLALAAALAGDPPYLLLDEPANGLDPQGIRWLRDFLTSLTAEGRTVLLSSHQLAEMAQTADEVIVLGRGQILTQGRLDDFVEQFARRDVLVRSPRSGAPGTVPEGQRPGVAPGRTARRFGGHREREHRADRRTGRAARHHAARADGPGRLAGRGLPGGDRGQHRLRDGRPVTGALLDTVRMEVERIRTLRAVWYLALLAVALGAVAAAFVATTPARGALPPEHSRAVLSGGSSGSILPFVGLLVAQPWRSTLMAARMLVLGDIAATTGVIQMLTCTLTAVALGRIPQTGEIPKIAVAHLIAVVLFTWAGAALGWLTSSAAVAVGIVLLDLMMLEPLVKVAGAEYSDTLEDWAKYLPFTAARDALGLEPQALAVSLGFALALLGGAWVTVRTRDY